MLPLFGLILLIGCHIQNKDLIVTNSSNEVIYYFGSFDTLLSIKGIKPDIIEPNKSDYLAFSGDWKYSINKESPDSTLHIYFFKTPIMNNDLLKERKYKRLDFKIKDLDRLKWVVVYDGK